MARGYTHVKAIEKKVFEMKEAGKTNREVAEEYGLTLEQIKNLVKRHNRAERVKEEGEPPRKRGRPRKNDPTTDKAKDDEIKRLRMENELLRDFLRLAGRR